MIAPLTNPSDLADVRCMLVAVSHHRLLLFDWSMVSPGRRGRGRRLHRHGGRGDRGDRRAQQYFGAQPDDDGGGREGATLVVLIQRDA